MAKRDIPAINPNPRVLARAGIERIPTIISNAGPDASRRFIEFFAVTIRNKNTRLAYSRAVLQFICWCEGRGVRTLIDIQPVVVAAYIEKHQASAPTVKQHLAAIRMLFDWLVIGQIVPHNPATSVRGPRHVVKKGKTPVLTSDQARHLINSIDVSTIIGLRDRALIGVMVYSFSRVSAATAMRMEDYFQSGKRWWFRLHEKGGKRHEVPAHHNAEEYLDEYLKESAESSEKKMPIFRTISKRGGLTNRGITRTDALKMIKRRAIAAGLPHSTCLLPHVPSNGDYDLSRKWRHS